MRTFRGNKILKGMIVKYRTRRDATWKYKLITKLVDGRPYGPEKFMVVDEAVEEHTRWKNMIGYDKDEYPLFGQAIDMEIIYTNDGPIVEAQQDANDDAAEQEDLGRPVPFDEVDILHAQNDDERLTIPGTPRARNVFAELADRMEEAKRKPKATKALKEKKAATYELRRLNVTTISDKSSDGSYLP